ncbi:NADH-cytochrome b5 reductase, partial [Rhizopus azygosporus]
NAILDPKIFKSFKLIEKTSISHNTSKYRFQLPRPDDVLGLPIGQHISIMAEINGKQISRSYTPTTPEEGRGYFDLVIKSYPTGNISKLMGELKVGDSVGIRGPKGNFAYTRNMVRAIGMIAGGTGITPMLQIIRRICNDPLDKTKIDLIFANVTMDDILLKNELDEISAKAPDNFKVHYVLEKPPPGWTGEVGLVTKDIIKAYCPPPAKDIKLLLCGPMPMIKLLTAATTELGYQRPRAVSKMEDQVYKF